MVGLGPPQLLAKFDVASFRRCTNIKGNPTIWGAPIEQSHWCGFMVSLGKPKLCTEFEVTSFSHCVNIEVKPQNFGALR